MSIQLMSNVWKTNLKGSAKLVLLALADYANDDGELFPSLATIAKKAGVGKTNLLYILSGFEDTKVILRTKRKRENGSNTSSLYKILRTNIDEKEFQKAYQNAKKYTPNNKKSSQSDQGQNSTKVHKVTKVNANSDQLEPSYILTITKKEKEKEKKIVAIEILNYLNTQANKNFRAIDNNLKNIIARLEDNYTKENLIYVIQVKVADWKNNKEYNKFLRPSTLFTPKNFDNYLNQDIQNTPMYQDTKVDMYLQNINKREVLPQANIISAIESGDIL